MNPLFQTQTATAHILMCPPDYFTLAYAINPWMRLEDRVNSDLAYKQWTQLVEVIEKRAGAAVHLMDPVEGLPDLVFTANAAFVYQNTAIIARYKHPERQGEEPYCKTWFTQHGFRVVSPPADMPFEGAGDALLYQDRVFAGYRARTDILSHQLITQETGLPILSMELNDARFYHIDVCICPLTGGYFIYTPDAFDEYGKRVIEANVPEDKRIPVTPQEASAFACNAVNIGQTVIFNQQATPRLQDALKDKGFDAVQVDLSEFIKAGGSAKCLTLKLAGA